MCIRDSRSVELAKKYNVELEVLSSLNPIPGTVVKEVTKDMEGMPVSYTHLTTRLRSSSEEMRSVSRRLMRALV